MTLQTKDANGVATSLTTPQLTTLQTDLGLQSAAFQPSTAFATAAQGALAATAVQNINGKTGTSVTLAAADVGALTQTAADARYATTAQGALATTAIQSSSAGTTGLAVLAATSQGAAQSALGIQSTAPVYLTASRNLSAADLGADLRYNGTADIVLTYPTGLGATFFVTRILQLGVGRITVSPAASVTLLGNLTTSGVGSGFGLSSIAADSAVCVAYVVGGDTGRVHVASTGTNADRANIQAANDVLRERGGGVIVLDAAVYTLDTTGLTIDAGGSVGLEGNCAVLDCRTVAAGSSALTIGARTRAAGPLLPGFDTGTTTYNQKRAKIHGFSLFGPTSATATTALPDGIDVNMPNPTATQSPRCVVANVTTIGFYRGVRHRNRAYLCEFTSCSFSNAQFDLSLEGGADQGENTTFYSCTFGNATQGAMVIDTQPETGTTENVSVMFAGCSFDYCGYQMIKFVTGYGLVRFGKGCHFEWSQSGSSAQYPFDFGAAASNRMLWDFDGCDFTNVAASNTYPCEFNVGTNHDVRITDSYIHSLGGVGVLLGATASPTAGPLYQSVIANVTGNGRFKIKGIVDLTTTKLPKTPTNIANNNWLADGGFELNALADCWWFTGGISSIAVTNADKLLGTYSLQVNINSAVNTSKKVLVAIPRRDGRFVSACGFAKLSSGGTGAVSVVSITPALITGAITPGTAPTINYLGTANGIDANRTISAAGWTNFGISGSLSRVELPDWANYVILTIDLFNVNNNGGYVLIDNVQFETQ